MKMLEDAKIRETKIYVLNPDYVREHAEKGAIARVSWLYDFNYDSQFVACDRYINLRGRVRGVRKKTDKDKSSARQSADISSDLLRRRA